jgi:CRISPR-associated exonuclease Cas4
MKLKHVYIENFRSIATLDFDCADLTVLVGKNSVGKSNILLAIELFFNTSDKILSEDMFCNFVEDRKEIVIELTFGDLTEEENAGRLKKYVCGSLGPGIKVRKIIKREDGKLKSYYHGWVEEPEMLWLQSDFKDYGKQAFWKDKGIDFFSYTVTKEGRITSAVFEEFRQNYIEKHKDKLKFELRLSPTEFEGLKPVGRDMLPEFKLIPAIGDVSDIVVGGKTSLLNRIVSQILQSVTDKVDTLKEAQKGLETAISLVNRGGLIPRLTQIEALEKWFCQEFKEWGDIDFEISTSFPDIDEILAQNLQVIVNDGSKGDISTKGHGLQRQLIFRAIRLSAALIKGEVDWADVGTVLPAFPPIILAFEEPELYLHPQAQLAFYDDIKKLSEHDQILLCTHSTHLVDIEDFEGIKILRREALNTPTNISECTKDLFGDLPLKKQLALAKLFDANVNKVFFADKIVIVEGDEDVIAITKTAKENLSCFTHRVTLVNASGKGNIPYLQRVLNAFRIPYTVVYDIDLGDSGSEVMTKNIEELVGQNSPFGLCSSMPMNPDLATVAGYGEMKDEKVMGCVKFFSKNKPSEEFCGKVKTLYELPKAGILTPS